MILYSPSPSLLRECYQFLVLRLQVMQLTCCHLCRGLDTACGMQWIPWLHLSAWTSSHSITLPGVVYIVHALQCIKGNCPPFDSMCSLSLVHVIYVQYVQLQVCTCYVHVHVHVEVVWLHVQYMCEWFRRGFSCLLRCEGTRPSKGVPYMFYMFMYVYMSCISRFVGLQHIITSTSSTCVGVHVAFSILPHREYAAVQFSEKQRNRKTK